MSFISVSSSSDKLSVVGVVVASKLFRNAENGIEIVFSNNDDVELFTR